MSKETFISILEREADEEICDLPSATVGRPSEVAKLELPFDTTNSLMKGSQELQLQLSLASSCNCELSEKATTCRKRNLAEKLKTGRGHFAFGEGG